MDGGQDYRRREAHVQSAGPVRAGFLQGLKDEVVGCRWVVVRDSGEAVGEGNGTFLGLIGRSQTRVPGFALSCPYHCTSASSEHRGLLRKQLSLKDLQSMTQDQHKTDFRERWFISEGK